MAAKKNQEPTHPVMLRLPESQYQELFQVSLEESAKTGKRVSVQEIIIGILSKNKK